MSIISIKRISFFHGDDLIFEIHSGYDSDAINFNSAEGILKLLEYCKIENADRFEVYSSMSGEWEGMNAETEHYALKNGSWIRTGIDSDFSYDGDFL